MKREKKIRNKTKNKIWNVVFGTKGQSAFPVGQGEDDDFYDDCPICQLLKKCKEEKREPSETEIREASQKAKEQGGIVGGK